MAKQSLNGFVQHLRNVASVQTYRRLSDRELLERYVEVRDEAAFTALLERHGPMVLGVCRRALPSFHDAEDACQASFLVLARKAASVRKKTALSSWLHGVACRLATKLKRDHARRRNRECRVAARASSDPAAEVSWREAQAILDEELRRLPDRYRAPLILCYLECLTRDEAAQRLGLSAGNLHGKLERARRLLRDRLTQRGLALSAVMSAATLGECAAQAALSPTFVVSSTKAAMLLAAGQPLTESLVATEVIALTQKVLKSMFLTKLKLGTVAVLSGGLFVALIGTSITSLCIAQDAQQRTPILDRSRNAFGPDKVESDADFIRRISKDLRGTDPTPAEVHFFVASKDAGKRQTLIDLFIQERQAKVKPLDTGNDVLIDNLIDFKLRISGHAGLVNIGDAHLETFPSAEEVLLALPEKTRTKNFRGNCQLVKYQLDDAKYYPLVGRARLEHAHFKCTVVTDDGTEVVYVNHARLIRQK